MTSRTTVPETATSKAVATAARPRVSRQQRRRLEDTLVMLALCLLTVIFFFPIYTVLSVSFKSPIDIMATPIKWVFRPTMDNYLALAGILPSEFQFNLPLHFRNSLIVATGSTLLSLVLGTPAAYAFARVPFRGQSSALIFLLGLRMLPPITTVIPLFLLMRELHLLDTQMALILAYTTFNLPFIVWMLRSFFIDLPQELEEASWIDGATRWQSFVRVILPLSAPGLVAASIFSLMLSWNDFIFAVILTSRKAPTLPMLVAGFTTEMGVSWGIMMAAGSVIVVPVLLFTLFVQRYLVMGLTSGAVKG